MQPTDIIDILSKSRPFVHLNKEQLTFIVSFGQLLEYEDDSEILTQGVDGKGIYVIIKGKTNVKIRQLGEETITLAQLGIGDFFGEINLLHTTQCTATVSANQKTICFFLPKICFDSFAIGRPDIRYAMCKALIEDVIQRYRVLNKKLVTLLAHQQVDQSSISISIGSIHEHHDLKKVKAISAAIGPSQTKAIREVFDFLSLSSPNLQAFTQKEVSQIIQNCHLLPIKDKAYFIKENQTSAFCYLIIDGAVQINIVSNKSISHFAVHPPFTLICPISFIDQHDEIFSYNTCGPATLLALPREYLLSLAQDDLNLWYKLYNLCCDYIFSLQKKLNTQVTRLTSETF